MRQGIRLAEELRSSENLPPRTFSTTKAGDRSLRTSMPYLKDPYRDGEA